MSSTKTRARTIGLLILVFAGFFVTGNLLAGHFLNPSVESTVGRGKPVNILIMGIDARNAEVNTRSDTMIVASIDRKTRQVVMVWIPRDTRVKVGGHYNKINSVNALEGPEAAAQAAGDLLGTRIDYYVVTNFAGFEKIIDILGGVDIDVETAMVHYDPDPRLNIKLSKGQQHLNGLDALRYVRYRGGPTADIGRTVRQQKFVNALAKEMLKPGTIIKLPKLLPELAQHVRTNIPASDLLFMGKVAREFDAANITTQTLPGYPYTEPSSGASYWQADSDIADGILEDLFNGKTYDVAQDPPNWVQPAAQPVTNELLNEEIPPEQMEDPESGDGTESENLPEDEAGPEGYLPDEDTGENEDADDPADENTGSGNTDSEEDPESDTDPSSTNTDNTTIQIDLNKPDQNAS